MKPTRRALALACALALITAASAAFAQPAKPAAVAPPEKPAVDERARFKAAQQLYDSGDFAGALPIFREVVVMGGSPNARLYAGRCLRELGRLPEAYAELDLAVRDAGARADKEARYAATRDAAAAERAVIAAKIGLLIVAVADRPAQLVVTVNGAPVAADHLGEAMAVAPGPAVVEATAPGRERFRQDLTLQPGASATVVIALHPVAAVVAPLPPQKTGGQVRTAGFAVAGLGVVGWGTFLVAGLLANGKFDAVSAACGGVRCKDASHVGDINAGKTLDAVANVGLATGLLAGLGGAAMIFFGGPTDQQVVVDASPKGAWLGYRGSF